MSDSTYHVIELIGSSSDSWELAAQNAVREAAKAYRDLRVAEVVEMDVLDLLVLQDERRMSDLAAALRVDPSTVTRTLQRMEAIRRLSRQTVSDDFASPEPPLVRGGNESVYQVHTVGGVGATFAQAARFAVAGVCSQFDDGRVGSIRRLGCRIHPDGTVRFAAEVAVSVKFQPIGATTS